MKTQAEAEALGFTIDGSGIKRPVAYKGPRFNPTAFEPVLTELEEELLEALETILADCETAEAKATAADWDFAVAMNAETARAAITKARGTHP